MCLLSDIRTNLCYLNSINQDKAYVVTSCSTVANAVLSCDDPSGKGRPVMATRDIVASIEYNTEQTSYVLVW